ncbi:nucleoside recognition domain-containing protein [Flavobacterium sp.]|jgi:spore maturation protein SpmA/spore maturation protein SpmB|uniref:nucleoside recognition domain-containing protein n=1 Tax=Flavobacterium sp. TaxID=239 RepID=UPI002A81BC32|nr:nucleoside recognition domain-containing protein [Flavobacterium sp.]
MVLSRFWLAIFISSIAFVVISLFSGTTYTIDYVLNGERGNPILISEKYIDQVPAFIKDSIQLKDDKTMIVNRNVSDPDTTYVYKNQTVQIYSGVQKSDGLLATCKSSLVDIIIPLIAYLAFFCGLMELLIISGVSGKLAKVLSPVFVKVFPSIPKNHPSISYMTLNFAANFLGLDSAATPFGLKAMESLQELNEDKDRASDSQIMFMCLHASGLTLIATSIIGYRAAAGSSNPADVMLPCIITSFIGTIAAFLIVGIKQKINFKSASLAIGLITLIGAIIGLLMYVNHLDIIGKNYFTSNLSGLILLAIIGFTLLYAFKKEKLFAEASTTVFDAFVKGANNGVKTGVTIFPYVLGMLAAISLFRNSGLFDIISNSLAYVFSTIGVNKQIIDSLPVALLRPFSSAGSRGFLIDSMNTFGADSLTGRLSSIFQCSAESTFYVIAVYFGSVNIKNTRYALTTMLLVDLICVITAIFVASWFF